MSSTGSKFTSVKFQIDTAATCNTISENMLATLQPRAAVVHSPYLLFPYGNSKPIEPLGQVELLSERCDKFENFSVSDTTKHAQSVEAMTISPKYAAWNHRGHSS
jgi:hypothetical protein